MLPSCNLVFIILRVDEPDNHIPFILLVNLPLDLGQGSAVEDISKWTAQRDNWWAGSRSQTTNCIEEWLVELIQSSPFQSLVECLAHISASPPKVDVVPIVGHRVLDRRESDVLLRREQEDSYPNCS